MAPGAVPSAGWPVAALAAVDPDLPRHTAASAYLHEKAGDQLIAAWSYADAARSAPNLAERDHLPGRRRGSIRRCGGEPAGQLPLLM